MESQSRIYYHVSSSMIMDLLIQTDFMTYVFVLCYVYRDQMEEAFKKAALAFQQKKRAVSTYYAHQGHLHRMRFKEANKRAAEVIYRQK